MLQLYSKCICALIRVLIYHVQRIYKYYNIICSKICIHTSALLTVLIQYNIVYIDHLQWFVQYANVVRSFSFRTSAYTFSPGTFFLFNALKCSLFTSITAGHITWLQLLLYCFEECTALKLHTMTGEADIYRIKTYYLTMGMR